MSMFEAIEELAKHGITAEVKGVTEDTQEYMLTVSTRSHSALLIGEEIDTFLDTLTGHHSPEWLNGRGRTNLRALWWEAN